MKYKYISILLCTSELYQGSNQHSCSLRPHVADGDGVSIAWGEGCQKNLTENKSR